MEPARRLQGRIGRPSQATPLLSSIHCPLRIKYSRAVVSFDEVDRWPAVLKAARLRGVLMSIRLSHSDLHISGAYRVPPWEGSLLRRRNAQYPPENILDKWLPAHLEAT